MSTANFSVRKPMFVTIDINLISNTIGGFRVSSRWDAFTDFARRVRRWPRLPLAGKSLMTRSIAPWRALAGGGVGQPSGHQETGESTEKNSTHRSQTNP
jgi:hypothetical protein